MAESHGDARVAVTTLGCKVNQVESEQAMAALLARGVGLAEPEDADTIVVHTCCVTGEAEKKVRKAVRRALRTDAHRVFVSGCLASIDPSGLEALDQRVSVVPDIAEIPDAIAPGTSEEPAPRVGGPFHTRVMVKVEDGCDAGCTYCIVPAARGNPRSVPLTEAMAEVERLVGAGVAEVVLTGVNLGRYADAEAGLPELIAAVAATGVKRLRLSSIEPADVDERLLAVLAATPASCPHLHVPLQSGSDDVLDAMGRGYRADDYLRTIQQAADTLPGLAVTTDVMAGFPGETDADHAATLSLLEELTGTVSKLHVFRYSKRPGTPASLREDQVPAPVARERAARLRELGHELRRAYLEGRVGTHARVLVERSEGSVSSGTSEDYLQVDVDAEGVLVGSVLDVELSGVEGLRMTARVRTA